jgi:hypothetical protein
MDETKRPFWNLNPPQQRVNPKIRYTSSDQTRRFLPTSYSQLPILPADCVFDSSALLDRKFSSACLRSAISPFSWIMKLQDVNSVAGEAILSYRTLILTVRILFSKKVHPRLQSKRFLTDGINQFYFSYLALGVNSCLPSSLNALICCWAAGPETH